MPHTIRDKTKLLARVRRIRGQVEAVERALEAEESCSTVLHRVAACRGALSSLMVEVLEGHVRSHVLDESARKAERAAAAEELLDVVKAYVR